MPDDLTPAKAPYFTTRDWLRKARGFIERGWTQGVRARDFWGDRCEPTAAEAREWCAVGAIHAARPGATFRQQKQMFNVLQAALNAQDGNVLSLATYNDARGTRAADILALYDRAIGP